GPYLLQAAIAAVHSEAASAEATDWRRIRSYYDLLAFKNPSPVVRLNRAVAVAFADGLTEGIALVEGLLEEGDLSEYYLLHAALGDLNRRVGNLLPARKGFEAALALVEQDAEKRFLQRRLTEIKQL
ncbi:RNA polymerase subunit sigma-24, partial [Burkholderia cenocepacia]|nr:RNA polymerase subunit sigma-24 [Burkholderia cenocepacia]